MISTGLWEVCDGIDGGLSHPIWISSEEGNEKRKVPFRVSSRARGIEYSSLQVPKCYTSECECKRKKRFTRSVRPKQYFVLLTSVLMREDSECAYAIYLIRLLRFWFPLFLTGSVSTYSREYFTGGSTRDPSVLYITCIIYTASIYMCTNVWKYVCAWGYMRVCIKVHKCI